MLLKLKVSTAEIAHFLTPLSHPDQDTASTITSAIFQKVAFPELKGEEKR